MGTRGDDLRQEREPEITLTISQLREIIRDEVEASFGALKTSSAEIYRNGKGERTVTIKQYDSSAQAAYSAAAAVFDQAVRELGALGGSDSPYGTVRVPGAMREERA
jgi:hypothetical protein